MTGDLDPGELRTLCAAMSDGTLAPDQHARLEKILAGSAEARRRWFLHCDIETGLADYAAERGEKVVPFSLSAAAAKPASPSRFQHWFAPLAAAAAVLLAALWWSRSADAPAPAAETPATAIAVLARAVGAEWADATDRPAGTALAPGTLRLNSGAALVEFYGGARVIVEGPAEFRLVSAGEAFLRAGKINAHVPPQARGFTVGTPSAKVVDHGTDFGVSLRADAPPEVHVFSGKVEVTPASQPPRDLLAGQGLRLAPAGAADIPATRDAFLAEDELARRDTADAAHRLAAWRAAAITLSADAAMLIHYRFDENADRHLSNHSASALPPTHGTIIGGAWATGRWPGKDALAFRSAGDRVRFTLPQSVQAITLLAWVRVESLARWQNVLLAADSEQPGALRWHLTQRGELRLEIARDLGRPSADWEAVNSAPFVTPERFGQWLLLATTFDGKTVRHFANGQPIGTGASFTPPVLNLGTAELGNWSGQTQRHLAAAMDEFAILARVLSEAEIRACYQTGRP